MINRRRSGVRGTPAKVNANAGLAAGEAVNSASVSDGSHESGRFRLSSHRPPGASRAGLLASSSIDRRRQRHRDPQWRYRTTKLDRLL